MRRGVIPSASGQAREEEMNTQIFRRSVILAAALLAIAHTASAQPRPEIVVLATGGTIAGAADVRSAAGSSGEL
jgi:L-asparaginase/Glu-tRNA(Gln) amidotransferase subunit D